MVQTQIQTERNYKEEIVSAGSERAILTLCLNNNDLIAECEEHGLSPDYFIVDANRYIYMSIKYLYESNQVPEPLAIMEVIADNKAKEAINDIGGLEYLSALNEEVAVQRNIEIYIKKLKQTFTRRELIKTTKRIESLMLDESSKVLNPTELIGVAQGELDELSTIAEQTEEVYKVGDDLLERLEMYAEMPSDIIGLESGYKIFDTFTGGMLPADLMFICARSKCGKSVLLENISAKLGVFDKLPILYIDTEMPDDQFETRLVSLISGLPEKEQIKSGKYSIDDEYGTSEEKVGRLKRAVELIKEGSLYHVYMPNFTIEKVSSLTRKYKMKYDISAMFFDYLKMPQANKGALKYAQEYQELGFLASTLKDLAGILEIPIYSAVQANRTDRGATASEMDEANVGGSDRILQLASKLVFLANKKDEDIALHPELGNQQLRVKFQRNGECDCPPINIQFDRKILRMKEVG